MFSADHHVFFLHQRAEKCQRDFRVLNGIDFCSNDYLSLKSDPDIKKELSQFFSHENTWCSTGSRLVSGNSENLLKLEERFARFVNRPCALFFANGYQANLAAISILFSGCIIFSDEFNHASIIDGVRLSNGDKFLYRHGDLDHLEDALKKDSNKPRAIITESIFSTSGQMSDIASLDFLARKYQAFLMVDEAHATGVFGKSGAGLLEELLYRGDHIVSTHSCGKALGSFGSFVACSNKVYEIIKNLSRSFICTTAPPPYLTAHVHAVLRRIQNESVLRERLFENIAHARGILKTKSPIISVSVNNDQCALFIREHMAQNGFDIAVFRYPSVPKDRVQLRITLHSGNTSEQIDRLQKELEGIL